MVISIIQPRKSFKMRLLDQFVDKILNGYKPKEMEVLMFDYYTMVIYPKKKKWKQQKQ